VTADEHDLGSPSDLARPGVFRRGREADDRGGTPATRGTRRPRGVVRPYRARVTTLRRASAADAPAIAEVFLTSFHATYDFPLAHTDDEVRGWVRDRLVVTEETWVADEGGTVVGMMVVAPGHLEQLYVAPDRLGAGIGRQLVDVAKHRSPDGLSLWTFQVNDRARRFYERNGFEAVELTDGDNQEGQPDVRYVWPGDATGAR
jgi:GNAT superfamily N-acetyltransferase